MGRNRRVQRGLDVDRAAGGLGRRLGVLLRVLVVSLEGGHVVVILLLLLFLLVLVAAQASAAAELGKVDAAEVAACSTTSVSLRTYGTEFSRQVHS